jgi:hypothetical protein
MAKRKRSSSTSIQKKEFNPCFPEKTDNHKFKQSIQKLLIFFVMLNKHHLVNYNKPN